jgi:prophage tail gpP-like protein
MRVADEKAVIDRIVDGRHAVLIVGEDERQVVVPATSLPAAAGEGTWLRVRFDGDTLLDARIDREETERVRQRVSAKMEQLRQRGRGPR